MGVADLSLGLPEDIDADPGVIRDKSDSLTSICSRMTGRVQDADGHFNDAAGEFAGLVAWDLSAASAAEVAKWEETAKALTDGAAVMKLWADDIETYRTKRSELEERWNSAKSSAQWRLDNPFVSGAAESPLFPLAGGIEESLTAQSDREAEEVDALIELRSQLLAEHSIAWDTLMDQADQTEKDLRDGPSAETLERLIESGHLSWRHLGIFPPEDPPPLSEEQGDWAAEEMEIYLDDPENYEGDIAEVLAMLSLVTTAGAQNQRNGGQPPGEYMDFLEAFYEGFEDSQVNIEGPRGVLGVVDLLENSDAYDPDIAQGFLSSMSEGLMVLSDEDLFGGYDRLPESVRRAAEGPSLMDPDEFEHYDLNTWSSEVSALEILLGNAPDDLRAGVDLSATLALSMGHFAGGSENNVDVWLGEDTTLSLVDIASRNHDAMTELFTGEYEHPNFVDENGDFKETVVDESHQDLIDRAIVGLYTHDWSDEDNGEIVGQMTDWIAEEANSSDPKEATRSERAMVGLVTTLTNLQDELSETGHSVEETVGGETVTWRNASFGHVNPGIADSLADIFEAHVEAFADNEILDPNGNLDPDKDTSYSYENGAIIDLRDRTDFVQLISGSPEAAMRVVEIADEYSMNSLSEYVGSVGEGNPDQTAGTRSGLLLNAVATGVAEEVTSRIEAHNVAVVEEGSDTKIGTDFVRDFTATYIPNAKVAETYKFVWNGVEEAIKDASGDGTIEFPRNSTPPLELNENVIRIYTMGAIHDHGGLDIPPPPEGTLNEDGTFNTDASEWDIDSNGDGQDLRDDEWDAVSNHVWPGSETDKEVWQVADGFYEAFSAAFDENGDEIDRPNREGAGSGE
ncbi:hypothetical protein [Nocardiopsis sp. FIRDI 009]|uniref:TPR repeat region-containing protein n=1 Tax=Nocardiopsis sp. FIRDI 009 TaxID=714197 RepID=UPI0013004600|nr:hypothetical protein [Nocardiopsis sp. FIRDI 009]